jgi:nicotinamide-nucleotide amidase
MVSDAELYELAARAGERLLAAGARVATAESCTGGWLSKALTDVAGSSQWFECGYVTYSNAAKMRDLGVAERTLAEFGAVSEQTARELAQGALRVAGVSVALAITGIAGPDGGSPAKPVGTVWLAAAAPPAGAVELVTEQHRFPGDRAAVRSLAVRHALALLLRLDLRARDGARRPAGVP